MTMSASFCSDGDWIVATLGDSGCCQYDMVGLGWGRPGSSLKRSQMDLKCSSSKEKSQYITLYSYENLSRIILI